MPPRERTSVESERSTPPHREVTDELCTRRHPKNSPRARVSVGRIFLLFTYAVIIAAYGPYMTPFGLGGARDGAGGREPFSQHFFRSQGRVDIALRQPWYICTHSTQAIQFGCSCSGCWQSEGKQVSLRTTSSPRWLWRGHLGPRQTVWSLQRCRHPRIMNNERTQRNVT